MKPLLSQSPLLVLLFAASGLCHAQAAPDSLCAQQANEILERLQREVIGDLSPDDRGAASRIVVDVCEQREEQVEQALEQEVELAVEKAREEEQAKADAWLTESADKPGNRRLKRKSH